MKLEQGYVLKHQGKIIFKGTQRDCIIELARIEGHVTRYELIYAGYSIEKMEGLKIIKE